ncbi:amino acid adenylation domain-containing protein [Aliikangiella maris]|uniref:Amino acid adenylation domain-containing protein n=2 Tax=Aliikangiella maris TaxID=3162458 RepID=A0ABV2BXX4_9GAMM
MSIYALMNLLHERQIKIWLEGEQLKFRAPKGALTENIREQLTDNKPAVIRFLKQITGQGNIPPIEPVCRQSLTHIPLSYSQERIWFISQLNPGSASYNSPIAIVIRDDFDRQHLQAVLNRLIERHENLRTLFPAIDGKPEQQVLPHMTVNIDVEDHSDKLGEKSPLVEAKRLCQIESEIPFDLAKGPLIRAKVFKVAPQIHVLMLNMHHIIGDGWSIRVLLNEFATLSEEVKQQTKLLPPLPIQYIDYVIWQRHWLETQGVLKKQLAYWKTQLSDMPALLDLPTDFIRPKVQSFNGATYAFSIGRGLTEQLKVLAEKSHCTLYMVLLSIYKLLLFRYSQQADICVGGVIANRQTEETEKLIGLFINSLAIRSIVDPQKSYIELLNQVRITCLEAYENQDAPFDKVVDALKIKRDISINPLFQVMLVLQNMSNEMSVIEQVSLDSETTNLDQIIEFTETPDGIKGIIEYSCDLFKTTTIVRLLEHFKSLCEQIVADPHQKLSVYELLTASEKSQLLTEFNHTAVCQPVKNVYQLFLERVQQHPHKIAVQDENTSLSFRQLHAKSSRLANWLVSHNLKPGELVGVYMHRAVDMQVAIMAIIAAGAAYVPLEPVYPDERINYLLNDAECRIILTQEIWVEKLNAILLQAEKTVEQSQGCPSQHITLNKLSTPLICSIDSFVGNSLNSSTALTSHVAINAQQLAYVIYTSGTTGQPKGVMIEHAALANRIIWMQQHYSVNQNDVLLQKTPFSFDVSVWEFFLPMISGATLIMAKPEGHKDAQYISQLINQHQVSLVHFVPSMLTTYLLVNQQYNPSIRAVFCSGEALEHSQVNQFKSCFVNAALHNLYGPTEAAVDVTAFACNEKIDGASVPIGKPIDNIHILILDENLALTPIGVPGELHIGGVGLARGYLNKVAMTEEKFIANPHLSNLPFNDPSLLRLYKTGDLARWLDDGNIEYLGRIDHQLKIRGFRIEPAEIEAILNQYPGVASSVVIAAEKAGTKNLQAYLVAKDEIVNLNEKNQLDSQAASLDLLQIKLFAAEHLPEHMLPTTIWQIDKMPLTHSGKVDRKVLTLQKVINTTFQSTMSSSAAMPVTQTQQQLAKIWQNLLEIADEQLNIEQDFFESGGNSLLAVQLMAKINQQYGIQLALATIFSANTITKLAALIDEQLSCVHQPLNLKADRSNLAVAKNASVDCVTNERIKTIAGSPEDILVSDEQLKELAPQLVVPIRPQGCAQPLVAIPGIGGNVLSFQTLKNIVDAQQPVYALQSSGFNENQPVLQSVEQIAKANIYALNTFMHRENLMLIGHSFGGVIAYEMIQQLSQQYIFEAGLFSRPQPTSVILLDSIAPQVIQQTAEQDEVSQLITIYRLFAEFNQIQPTIGCMDLRAIPPQQHISTIVAEFNRQRIAITQQQFTNYFRVYQANLFSYRQYKPKQLITDIEFILVKATQGKDNSNYPADYGWQSLLGNQLKIIHHDCDHFSILTGDNLQQIFQSIKSTNIVDCSSK